jgi:tetratricopeptide (TPR) repeat protein
LAESEDVDLKALALTGLHLGYTQQAEIRSFCAERLRRLGPSDPVRSRWAVAAGYCGDAWAEGGQIQNAIFGFKQALEVQPDNVITLSHLALACQRSGDLPQALTALKKASSLQPARAVLHFQLALIYQQVRQIPEAIRELEAGLQFAPDDPAANRMLEQLRSKL